EEFQTQSDPETPRIQRALEAFHGAIMAEIDQARMITHLAQEFERDPTLLGRQLGIPANHPLVVAYILQIQAMAQTQAHPAREEDKKENSYIISRESLPDDIDRDNTESAVTSTAQDVASDFAEDVREATLAVHDYKVNGNKMAL